MISCPDGTSLAAADWADPPATAPPAPLAAFAGAAAALSLPAPGAAGAAAIAPPAAAEEEAVPAPLPEHPASAKPVMIVPARDPATSARARFLPN